MESQRSPILFILVLVAVLQQHGHHVQTAPTTGARQTDPMHEMKAEQFSATNNLDLLGSRINWGLAEAEAETAPTTNDAMHRKEEEGERRLVSDIETLSTAATVHQSGLDDSSIKANDRNKTANDEEATSAASSSSASSTRTATENATPTSPLSTAGSPSSFTAVSSSSPSSIVPRKKIRRSTTTTTSTTALPPITTEEESEEVNQKSTENLLAKTTTDLDSEFTSSPRPKTRKMRKKVSKKIDWETSTHQQQVTTWTTTTGEEEVEATTVTSATSPEEELESNGMVTTTKFEIQSTTDYSGPPEEQRTIGAVGVESESVDEHDRGNAVRVTPTTTTRSTSPSTTTERQDMEVQSEGTTPGVLPGEVSMDYVSRIQTTTMGTNADGESSFVTGASSTSASELPLASGTVKTTEIDLPTKESPGFTLNQDQKPEGEEKNRKEDADEEELKVASKDSRTEANDHHTQLSAAKELFPKSSSSHPSPPAAADDENPPTKFENFESNAEEEAPSVQLSSIVPSTTTPSTPDQQHRQDLTSATEFVESTPIATHQDQIFVTHTPSEVVSTSSSSSSSANDLRLTSTTVFEDNSAITTTTEFISSQSAATPLGHVIHENSDASETQKRNEGDEKEQDKIADNPPTTEPRVEGINVENVEESLSPIPDDDVLVVEIEESNETPQVSQEEEETTTLVVTGGTYSSSPSAPSTEPPTTTLRPKLNDELFYPIGGREGGGVGGDETETELVRERGRVDLEDDNNESTDREEETKDIDGRGNDNDGDFDLEAEIFPTIPAPKNALFDSEILREKGDLKESDTDAEHVTSRGNGIVRGGHVETSTTVPSQSTTTRELDSPPKKTSSYKTIKTTSFEDSPEVSTTVGHHDSDTFFYISNTEVKVVESDSVQSPKAVSHTQELSFPENSHEEGLPRTLPHQNHSHRSVAAVELNERRRQQEQGERSPLLVEEDIILSQAVNENNFNSNRDPGGFDFLKFAAAERPQRVTEVEGETRSGEEVDQEEDSEEVTKRISHGNTEQLSFVKVEETTEVYSSEEAFEFLHRDREEEEQKFILSSSSSRERSREESIPEVIIEPYPQLMDTDNDLPISIGVPVIAELPQQIQIATANEEGHGHGQDEVKSGQLPSYHHFDIDNREIENANNDNSNNNRKSMKTTAVGKFKKSGPGKKKLANRKKPDREESFSEIIFENAENFLVKNPSISLEVPVLDFNFSILASTSTTMEPKLNFTNETTLMLEEEPIGINDLQTLFFTCFITLMLLVAAVFVAFVARFLWNKHYSYGTGLLGDSSTDPLDVKTRTLSTDVDEFKSRDSGISMFKTQDLETAADQYGNGIVPANSIGHKNGDAFIESNGTTTPYANGSIITMTLKNNHLIVETEERSDISRDARETKMHYSPSEKDGVFVVEVARGADTSYHSPRSSIIVQQQQQAQQFNGVDLLNTSSTQMNNSSNGGGGSQEQQQRVQVHHHPAPPEAQQAEVANGKTKCSTGLSQSDLSDSSGCSSNKDYNYGGPSGQGGVYIANSLGEISGQKSSSGNALTGGGEGEVEQEQQQQFKGQAQKQKQQQHRPVTKQETIDLQPRLQSDIDLVNNVETERREHCNGHSADKIIPDILVKSSGGAELTMTSLVESLES